MNIKSLDTIFELNKVTQKYNEKMLQYHIRHIILTKLYALEINKRLGAKLNSYKLAYIALVHDLFKERGLPKDLNYIDWEGHKLPTSTIAYVRSNIDVLEEYGLDEFFNSAMNYHPVACGIFLRKEFNIQDPEILYPVMFHSCPILDVYNTLSFRIQNMVDIILLSDKLSSNYLKINMKESKVNIDLDLAVFGKDGKEFNYTLGVYLARLIAQGNSKEIQTKKATEYYYNKLNEINPLINIKKLGGSKLWPKRKSFILKTA